MAEIFAYDLTHKHQTKANDCWYACIQMLLTQKKLGLKTKPIGATVANHRSLPILGRTLVASDDNSIFKQVLKDNGLILVAKKQAFNPRYDDSVLEALKKYGPIIIGGMYGRLFGRKKMGHYIVLSGVDQTRNLYKINDPDMKKSEWRTFHRVSKDYWGNVHVPDDCCNAIAADVL